ncbi:hypothetical protein [Nocardia sp. NBC_00565]|uniref:hypothetical protein n=1 Tax=Nocardia sp. NBC_00565 TaxID=2975993 RepID=UPI003FA54F29
MYSDSGRHARIGADYYLRLEQGRDRNLSAQVLEFIARARLDDDTMAYLLGLTVPKPRRPSSDTGSGAVRCDRHLRPGGLPPTGG